MRIVFTFCLSLFLFGALQAQTVEEVQQTLIVKRTATWCSACGSWGWDFFDVLIQDNDDKAVHLAAHFGGSSLENPTSLALVDNFGGFGQPKFFVDGQDQGVSSGNTATKRAQIEAYVDDQYASQPIANTGMDFSILGSSVDIDAKVKFFQDASGTYLLALYLVEDGVIAQQSSQGANAVHKYVLQDVVTNDAPFGEVITTGNVTAGFEQTFTYNLLVPGYDIDKLYIAAVIWEDDNGTYVPVNVFSQKISGGTSNVVITDEKAFQASIQPNVSDADNFQIHLDLPRAGQTSVQVFDGVGNLVLNLADQQLSAGAHQLELPAQLLPVAGTYRVLIQSGETYQVLELVKL
jgi:hypothetical protein